MSPRRGGNKDMPQRGAKGKIPNKGLPTRGSGTKGKIPNKDLPRTPRRPQSR